MKVTGATNAKLKPTDKTSNKKKGTPGKHANHPFEIPKKGWKQILLRVKNQLKYDHIQVVSAGVAFYFFLALFPAIAAFASIYGLATEPTEVQDHMMTLMGFLPEKASNLIGDILSDITNESGSKLGWSLVLSVLLSIWSANKGTSALFKGINIAYDEIDNRRFFKRYGLTLGFTFGGIILGSLALGLVVGFPALTGNLGLSPTWETVAGFLRWPILAGILIVALGIIYKICPDRDQPEVRWVSWGAIAATMMWIGGSLLFSLYVNNSGSFGETYGSFAAIIILLLWFFLTAFIILVGAEINAEMEHQTAEDTTVGKDKPMGKRDAYHANHYIGNTDKSERRH